MREHRRARCSAEPGSITVGKNMAPDQQRTTPQARRNAQHPGHELCADVEAAEFRAYR